MNLNYLDFEQPIAEIQAKIDELRHAMSNDDINITEELERLEKRCDERTRAIFSSLSAIQVVKLARHPQRPHTLDYIQRLFTEFDELHGDRHFSKGAAIVGGLARFNGEPVMVIGHQKGRSTSENLERNFGMSHPEEYRRALRLMKMAERFRIPVFTFIDTPGAYPGIGAEERNQSEAIARNLFEMSKLATPIICTVTGEGGSGGALALGVGDRVLMLQYSVYATISPEGCASILWRSQDKVADAAEAMNLTADKLLALGLIDEIIPEPLGGAHRNIDAMMATAGEVLAKHLKALQDQPIKTVLEERYQRLMSYGV